MRSFFAFGIALWLGLSSGSLHNDSPTSDPFAILKSAATALESMVTVSGKVKRTERVNGAMESGELRFKVNQKPLKIYLINLFPNDGTELLWVEGWNDGKVLIHPNQFPWVNINMDSYGTTMLKDQHHHLSSTGFVTMQRILKSLLAKPEDYVRSRLSYVGQEKWYGKPVDVIKIVHPDYRIQNYTVQAGDDLLKLDKKLTIPSYKILELNPEVEDYYDVKPGQVIKVPSHYGKEIVLMVDPTTHLPIVQLISDEKGLFEKYEYAEVKVNPRFTTTEFTEDHEGYGF